MKKLNLFIFLFIVAALMIGGIILVKYGFVQNTSFQGKEIKYTVPLMASLKCDKGTQVPVSYIIPEVGSWISKQGIGAYTPNADNIKVIVTSSWVDAYLRTYFGGGTRIIYKICDENKQNCGVENSKNIYVGGTYNLDSLPSAINLRTESVFIVVQAKSSLISSWKNIKADATLSYSYIPYKLVLYSPVGVGIKTVCESGCSLTCPAIGVRQTIVATSKDELNFDEATNYISTWVDVSQKDEQLGGTIFNTANSRFCFGGFIYQSGEITTETGTTYIYPETYLYKKDCCPGAVISTQYEDKICQSDYTWKIINKDTRIKCLSDLQCPNSGTPNCRNKLLNGWSCSGYDSTIGKYCVEYQGRTVACCLNSDCAADQTCSNNKCQGGAVNPPVDLNKCNFDSDCIFPNKCVNGNCQAISNPPIECCIPKWYQESYAKEVGIGPLGIGRLIGLKTTECGCRTASWLIWTIIIVILIIIALTIYLIKFRRK